MSNTISYTMSNTMSNTMKCESFFIQGIINLIFYVNVCVNKSGSFALTGKSLPAVRFLHAGSRSVHTHVRAKAPPEFSLQTLY